MANYRDVQEFLHKKEFSKAKEALESLSLQGEHRSIIDYLYGRYYEYYDNPSQSLQKAREYYLKSVTGSVPVDSAFVRLAYMENNKQHKLRIIHNGLRKFPDQKELYEMLLENSEDSEIDKVYSEISKKNITSRRIDIAMIKTFFDRNDYSKCLVLLNTFEANDNEQDGYLDILKGLCFFETNQLTTAKAIYRKLIDNDIAHMLKYVQYMLYSMCALENGEIESAFSCISEIPTEYEYYSLYDTEFRFFDYYFMRYLIDTISKLTKKTSKKTVIAKARGLRAQVVSSSDIKTSHTSAKILADFKYANKYLPANCAFCEYLMYDSIEKDDYLLAHEYALRYTLNNTWKDYTDISDELEYSYINKCPEAILNIIYSDMLDKLKKSDYVDFRKLANGPVIVLVERMYELKKYEKIVLISDIIEEQGICVDLILFNMAYSYSECGKQEKARKLYLDYSGKHQADSAAYNNLGVIYEGLGDFKKAYDYFKKALDLGKDKKLYKRNLTRIDEARESSNSFKEENLSVKRQFIALWYKCDIDGNLKDPVTLLKRALPDSSVDGEVVIEHFTDNNYLNYRMENEAYRINPFIEAMLPNIEKIIEKNEQLMSIVDALTPESFARIGYDDDLITKLKKVVSYDLQTALQRDLREVATTLLTKCYKSTLVLAGSIIEAVLLDLIQAKNIKKHTVKTGKQKTVGRMGLNDLLFVAQEEKLIDNHLYHLAQALRDFRNLIHPGYEKRRTALSVNEQNAKIAWEIIRKLINEL